MTQASPPLAPNRPRYLAPAAAAMLLAGMWLAGPIPQLANYHGFADQGSLAGVPHAGDVLSNLGFLLVALWGALRWQRSTPVQSGRLATAWFIAAIGLTGFGSAWYHLAPDNARLVWDRLPIALACAALLAAVLRSHLALLLLVPAALCSVFWWQLTGDLRPYLLLQLAPLVIAPLLLWQRAASPAEQGAFGLAIGLYVLAKLCELGDHAILALLGGLSGHTLKHLLATAAALVLVRTLTAGPE